MVDRWAIRHFREPKGRYERSTSCEESVLFADGSGWFRDVCEIREPLATRISPPSGRSNDALAVSASTLGGGGSRPKRSSLALVLDPGGFW